MRMKIILYWVALGIFSLTYNCCLTNYHTMMHFDALRIYRWLWKTLWEKAKLLVTSNFSFSHNVFYPIWYLFFILTLSQTNPGFNMFAAQVFWKHCGKRIYCSQRAISPFPAVFSTLMENFLQCSSNRKLWSANSLSLRESKICRLGKG